MNNKKYLNLVKFSVLLVFMVMVACMMVACGDKNEKQEESEELLKFGDIAFNSVQYVYDGLEKEIVISGDLPQNANIIYSNNKATTAGEYKAVAVITCEGYETKTLNATLKINKANYEMSGAYWDYNQAFTYDGNVQKVKVVNLPIGVTVKSYKNNEKIDAGNYVASVEFYYDSVNYNKPILSNCNWKINKADIEGIEFKDKTIIYDGNEHSLLISGILPTDVSVTYENNKAINVGSYNAKAILSGKNYNDLVLNAKLVIMQNLTDYASNIIKSIMKVPDPWEFLPESFAIENRAYIGSEVIDFENNFVNVDTIPTIGFGKQMDVVYSTMLNVDEILSYLRGFYATMNVVIAGYQTFINENPDNFATYEKTGENYKIKIVLINNDYLMYASYGGASIELSYSKNTQKCYG